MELELSDVCGIFGWQVWRQFPEKLERRSRASNLSYFPKYIRYLPFSHTEQIAEQRILQASHSRGVINVFAETLSASAKERLWLTKKLWRLCLHFMSNSTEDLSVVASKFVVWQVNFVWTSSRPRLSKVMLLTVTPSLKEEEAEKMRPLRYHTTRGGGLPAKNTKKIQKNIKCRYLCCGWINCYLRFSFC